MSYQSGFKPDLFAGQHVVVAGGGGGLGRCIAHELAALGAELTLLGRTEEKLTRTREEIAAAGGQVRACFALELRAEDAVVDVVQKIVAQGSVQGLVNAAGGQFPAQLAELSLNGWNAVLHNNLTSYFLLSRELYRQCFQTAGSGSVVHIGADWAGGMPGMGHNGAARAGLSNLTATAASEWGRDGVRVNCVIPGFIATAGLDRYPESDWPALRAIDERVPLGRKGTAAEVSAMVVFLMSPMAAYVTGADFRVDGGIHNGASSFLFKPERTKAAEVFNGFHLDEPPALGR